MNLVLNVNMNLVLGRLKLVTGHMRGLRSFQLEWCLLMRSISMYLIMHFGRVFIWNETSAPRFQTHDVSFVRNCLKELIDDQTKICDS